MSLNEASMTVETGVSKKQEDEGYIERSKADVVALLAKRFNLPYTHSLNWNEITEILDLQAWNKQQAQYWIDTRFIISNDYGTFKEQSPMIHTMIGKVFGGLSLLDTIQGIDSGLAFQSDTWWGDSARPVLALIQLIEFIHQKMYSTIFSTLYTRSETEKYFEYARTNEFLQYKGKRIQEVYTYGSPEEKMIASVLLESFLFYSGFYAPLRLAGDGIAVNTADSILKILADEKLHGGYFGAKYQQRIATVPKERKQELQNFTTALLFELYENEMKYTEEVYDEVGWTEDVKKYVRYNANVALGNLGYPSIFAETIEDINPHVAKALQVKSSNGDFFSVVNGSAYQIGKSEAVKEHDYTVIHTHAAKPLL